MTIKKMIWITDTNPYIDINPVSFDLYTEIDPPNPNTSLALDGKKMRKFLFNPDKETPNIGKTFISYIPGLAKGMFQEKTQTIKNNKVKIKNHDTLEFECDHIILAIGQRSDTRYLGSAVDADERGKITYGKKQETSLDGVYLAGDLCGPGSAIKAIAEGKKAAEEIDKHLGGMGLFIGDEIEVPVYQSHYSIWDTKGELEKVDLYTDGCSCSFEENRTAYTDERAKTEALRCMRCDRNSKQ